MSLSLFLARLGARSLLKSAPALLLGLSLLSISTAGQAANYSMTGFMRDHRGAISLPLAPSLSGIGRGVQGAGTVTQMGAAVPGGGPATIGVPTNVFFDPAQPGGFLIPVPSVIQLTTVVTHIGPTIPATLMAGRSGPANFAYCPGATANPSCTTVTAGASQGTLNGIVRYTAGPNQFGGTLAMLTIGTAKLTNKGSPLPPTTMTTMGATKNALPFSAKNYNLGGTSMVAAGHSYAFMNYFNLDSSPATHPYGYKTTTKGLLSRGPIVQPTGVPGGAPATGFPFTTGQVYLYRKFGSQNTGVPIPSKVTVTGYDARTAFGAGRIVMVAGSLSRSFPADGSNPPEGSVGNRLHMRMTMTPLPNLSLASPSFQVSLSALILLSMGYAMHAGRKRR